MIGFTPVNNTPKPNFQGLIVEKLRVDYPECVEAKIKATDFDKTYFKDILDGKDTVSIRLLNQYGFGEILINPHTHDIRMHPYDGKHFNVRSNNGSRYDFDEHLGTEKFSRLAEMISYISDSLVQGVNKYAAKNVLFDFMDRLRRKVSNNYEWPDDCRHNHNKETTRAKFASVELKEYTPYFRMPHETPRVKATEFANLIFPQNYGVDNDKIYLESLAQLNESIFRGGMPKTTEAIDFLADTLGVNNIISIFSMEKDIKEYAKNKGLNIIDFNPPDNGNTDNLYKRKNIAEVLDMLDNPDRFGKSYVHCDCGIHNTSLVIGMYRHFKQNWPIQDIHRECVKLLRLHSPSETNLTNGMNGVINGDYDKG